MERTTLRQREKAGLFTSSVDDSSMHALDCRVFQRTINRSVRSLREHGEHGKPYISTAGSLRRNRFPIGYNDLLACLSSHNYARDNETFDTRPPFPNNQRYASEKGTIDNFWGFQNRICDYRNSQARLEVHRGPSAGSGRQLVSWSCRRDDRKIREVPLRL